MPDIDMSPRPIGATSRPLLPSARFSMRGILY
jgi:hypothetical protein